MIFHVNLGGLILTIEQNIAFSVLNHVIELDPAA